MTEPRGPAGSTTDDPALDATPAPDPSPGATPDPALDATPAPDPSPGATPDPAPDLPLVSAPPPSRTRGSIALLEENCTVCMLCARECPDWCLEIEGHTEIAPAVKQGGRPRARHVLDRFAIDFSVCFDCGICIEVCPFDALFWTPEPVPAQTSRAALEHGRVDLREWLRDVPPPPAL